LQAPQKEVEDTAGHVEGDASERFESSHGKGGRAEVIDRDNMIVYQ